MPDVGGEDVVPEADCLDGILGLEVVSIEEDTAVARFPVQDRVRQRFGLVHGGAYAALAEMLARSDCASWRVDGVRDEKVPTGRSRYAPPRKPWSFDPVG